MKLNYTNDPIYFFLNIGLTIRFFLVNRFQKVLYGFQASCKQKS